MAERVSDLFGGEFCAIKLVGHGCEPWSVRLIALHLLLEVGEAPASRGLRASTRAFSCAVFIQIIPKIYVVRDFVSINSDRCFVSRFRCFYLLEFPEIFSLLVAIGKNPHKRIVVI